MSALALVSGTTTEALATANCIANPSDIVVGQRLYLPPGAASLIAPPPPGAGISATGQEIEAQLAASKAEVDAHLATAQAELDQQLATMEAELDEMFGR